MSEEPPRTLKRRIGCVFSALGVAFLVLTLLVMPDVIAAILLSVVRLLFGWTSYLATTFPSISFNFEMILCGVGALALAVWLAHGFIRWFRNAGEGTPDRKPWPLSATLACTALLLLMFGAAIAITGIVHQTGWLLRDGMTERTFGPRSRLSRAVQVAYQLPKGILVWKEDHGSPPQNLEDLRVEFGLDDLAEFRNHFNGPLRNGDRWLYFPEAAAWPDAKTVMILSPAPVERKWIVVLSDGSAEELETLRNLDLPFHPAPALDPMPAAER